MRELEAKLSTPDQSLGRDEICRNRVISCANDKDIYSSNWEAFHCWMNFSRNFVQHNAGATSVTLLSLHFTSIFNIHCLFDSLSITDGDGTLLLENSCGSSLPAAITSKSNTVDIKFVTGNSGSDNRNGWKLLWSALTQGKMMQTYTWMYLYKWKTLP